MDRRATCDVPGGAPDALARPAAPLPAHFVYIVRCADGSLYTGYARDLDARLAAHNRGTGAKYTCSRRPVRLVYVEALPTLSAALKREYELKQWPRAKKQRLIRAARRVQARG